MIGSFGGEDDAAKKKAAVVSIVAGFLYGVSWWVFIDAFALNSGDETTKRAVGYAWLPLVGTTIAFIMINGMNWSEMNENSMLAGASPQVAARARLFLVAAIFISLACLAASLFIMADVFLSKDAAPDFPGISVFVACMLQFLATWIMRAGTIPSDE